MRKVTSSRVTRRAALVLGWLLLFVGFSAVNATPPASAAVVDYYVVASNGVAIPNAGTTNVVAGTTYTNQTDRITLFSTSNGSNAVTIRRQSSGSFAYEVSLNAYSPAYASDTQIAANAQFFFAVNQSGGSWDGWRVTLFDYNPSTGASAQLSQVVLPSGNNTTRTLLTAAFTNSATTILTGHRLRVLVECDPNSATQVNMYANGAVASTYASYLRVNETPIVTDTTAPNTSLSTSPVAPDGDSGWFKSPVTVTLSAVDPEGSAYTIYYQWGVNPPTTVYASSFTVPSGTNTLYYRAIDVYSNAETVKSQVFNVDSAIVAPAITTPTGTEPSPTNIQGSVNVDATATDATSGVNYVAFYYFAWNGSSWEPVGTQIGSNQTAPVSGSTYRVSWNTGLVQDGRYQIQAQLRDVAGNSIFSPAQYVRVDNVGPFVDLSEPEDDSTIRGTAYQIRGTATDTNLTSWTLAIKPVSSGSWATLASGTSSVSDALLYTLDTTLYTDGQYQFRLVGVDDSAHSSTDLHTAVTIDNTGPFLGAPVAVLTTTVDVPFLEALDPASVLPAHFTIANLSVSGATLLPDGVTVRLTTSAQTINLPYTVVVKTTSPSVTDVAGNLVQAPANAVFTGYDPASDITPPPQPDAPIASSDHGRNRLVWSPSLAGDLAGYNVYRDTSAAGAFATKVNGATLITAVPYDDTGYGAAGYYYYYYYKVTAVDINGNESTKSAASGNHFVSVDQSVGAGGASLASSNGEMAINVPAGALGSSIGLRIDEQTAAPTSTAMTFVSSEYFFEPHGQIFTSPVTITVKYSPGAVDESTIRLVYYDGATWRPVEGGSVVNQAQDTVTGTVSHFSGFAAASLDVTAPSPPSVTPVDGATGFPVDGFIVLTFGEDMDPSTLTNDKVQIRVGGVDGTAISAETVVLSSDRKTVYVYPDKMMDISQGYTVWVSGSVTDLAGNPLGADFTSTFTTAATGVTPHGAYSASSNLCRNCHVVHGATGPKIFTEATEKQVCYTCHDGTGSSYNVKTADNTTPYAWDFGEAVIGVSTQRSYHPVPTSLTHTWVDASTTNTGVTMQCSNCHNAHGMTGTGQRFLAVKKLDPSFSGTYGAKTGNDFCWTCHNTTAATSAGYISSAAWNASTGFDHKTYYPTTDSGHNKSTGAVTMSDIRVPSAQNIACKGCHSEHGSTNDKLISEWVKGFEVTFLARTDNDYNTTYTSLCTSCHGLAAVGGFSWPGTASHDAAGHGASASTKVLSYSPPVPAENQTLRVGQCKQCHEPHGAGDANGAFLNLARYFEEGVCYVCHSAAGNPVGAKNLATVFGRATSHNLGLSTTAARKHDLNAEFAVTPAGTGNTTLSGARRHVECSDCHNTHLSTNTLHTKGSNAITAGASVLAGVWGISPTPGANWSDPSTWTWADANRVYPATAEYQLCLKCHSAAAYGTTPPSRTVNNTRGTSYWPIDTYTDQAKEFNPNNASYHAVWGDSKASATYGTYVNGWTYNSKMYCSDCHRSNTAGDPIGSHGSDAPFMLGGNTTPANSSWITGPGEDQANRTTSYSLCFNCHDPTFANTGFSRFGSNLHTNKHGGHSCGACHSAIPHGWQRYRMLVLRGDPAPYNDHGSGYGLPNSITWKTSGNWSQNDCHNAEDVGSCG
ncbi:MAG: cytochrome c3 family protein [Thermoleophilia bacterium]